MKKHIQNFIVLLLMLLVCLDSMAQLRAGSFSVGYSLGSTKLKMGQYNQSKDSVLAGKGKHNLLTLGILAAGKRCYFDMNLGLGVVKNDRTGNYFNTKLAFGGYIAKTVGIMVGGQYNAMRYQRPNSEPLRVGYVSTIPSDDPSWHQRGLGAHLFVDAETAFVRFSFMKDWIQVKNGGKGSAYTPEAALYFALDKNDHSFGFQIATSYSFIKLDAFESIAANTIKSFNINFAFMIPLSICGAGSASSSNNSTIIIRKVN